MIKHVFQIIFRFIEKGLFLFKKRKYVLFIAKNQLMFNNIIDILKTFEHDKRICCLVCFPSPHLMPPSESDKLTKEFNLKTIKYKFARFLKWDLVIFPDHSPYFREECKKIYINHGIFSGVKKNSTYYEFSKNARSENGKIIYDKIFLPSEYLTQQLSVELPEVRHILKTVGNVYVDKIFMTPNNKDDVFKCWGFNKDKKTLMFVSTWGDDSLLSTQGDTLLKKALEFSDTYNIILSLHPNCYRKAYTEGQNWPILLEQCKKSFNIYVAPPATSLFEILQYVDLYIADKTSLSIYFATLARPMILIDNPGISFNQVSLMKLVRNISPVLENISLLNLNYIESVFTNFKKSDYEELSKSICSYQGQSLKQHKIEIYDTLNLKLPTL